MSDSASSKKWCAEVLDFKVWVINLWFLQVFYVFPMLRNENALYWEFALSRVFNSRTTPPFVGAIQVNRVAVKRYSFAHLIMCHHCGWTDWFQIMIKIAANASTAIIEIVIWLMLISIVGDPVDLFSVEWWITSLTVIYFRNDTFGCTAS